jgi:hypothetical protein
MTIRLAGGSAASGRVGRLPAPHPDPAGPARARPRPAPATAVRVENLTAPRLERGTHFLIHELLAAAPELGRAAPSGPRAVAAYQAQMARRIHYSGPVAPVDLRV